MTTQTPLGPGVPAARRSTDRGQCRDRQDLYHFRALPAPGSWPRWRIQRWTAGFGRELLPPQILVVTFTDAATKELRERIRTRLAEAARFFRDETPAPDALINRAARTVRAGTVARLRQPPGHRRAMDG